MTLPLFSKKCRTGLAFMLQNGPVLSPRIRQKSKNKITRRAWSHRSLDFFLNLLLVFKMGSFRGALVDVVDLSLRRERAALPLLPWSRGLLFLFFRGSLPLRL